MQDTPLGTGDQGLYTKHVTDLGKIQLFASIAVTKDH